MAIRIDATELQTLLTLTPPSQNIMLIGRHGIGKSQIITQHYQAKGMAVVAFFLGQMSDPGDLIGLMHKDEATGRSVFLPPYWWPTDNQPIVLFLDELNRARPEILQAVQDLSLTKTLAGKTLPPDSVVIAAVNEGEEYQLTDLDPALVSRFNLYEFAPSVEDWLLWANRHEIDPRVISFIQKHHEHLDGEAVQADEAMLTSGLVKTPDRRAWAKVSAFVKPHDSLSEIHIKAIAGIVGTAAAIAFQQSLAAASKITAEQLLLRFEKYKDKLAELSMQETILLNEQLVFWLNGGNYKPQQANKVRQNFLAYLKLLKQSKHHEHLAHLATMIQNPKFGEAMAFLADDLEIIEFLTDYVAGIKVE